jgi:16S rRNA (uracil1498-N3)-methyltransferase
MNHFFLEPDQIQGDSVLFPREVSKQLALVFRLKSGDTVMVLDNHGNAYEVILEIVTSKATQGRVVERFPAMNEPAISLHLQVCLTQREKFEWILQKGTELGISAFTPVLSSRTLIQKPGDISLKYDRWRKIRKDAAEQCERGKVPDLLPPTELMKLSLTPGDTLALVLYEDEVGMNLKRFLELNRAKPSYLVLTGPEGGFSPGEINYLKGAGYQSVSMGKRILRMETAAIASAAIFMYEVGVLGGA